MDSGLVLRRPSLELETFHGMVTTSGRMLELFRLVRKVARTEASVLIRGETGTGKELVARALHDESERAGGPFRAINCATLTPELLASELFGHVRGAFTGAVKDRLGLFAMAREGTVFLDEIAELPLDLQARLLRVLQERRFVPVGATEAVDADVRVFAATHAALRELVAAGRFREDLMYRIRVVPLFLPRLAERDRDIEALAWHFVDELHGAGGRQVTGFEATAMGCMQRYPWPGNVRELRNVMEYAFAVGDGEVIGCGDLTPELRGEPPPGQRDGQLTAKDLERERLLDALRRSAGRKGEAADLLGMSRSTLWRKLREHGI